MCVIPRGCRGRSCHSISLRFWVMFDHINMPLFRMGYYGKFCRYRSNGGGVCPGNLGPVPLLGCVTGSLEIRPSPCGWTCQIWSFHVKQYGRRERCPKVGSADALHLFLVCGMADPYKHAIPVDGFFGGGGGYHTEFNRCRSNSICVRKGPKNLWVLGHHAPFEMGAWLTPKHARNWHP